MAGKQRLCKVSSKTFTLIIVGCLFFFVGLLSIEILTSIPDSNPLPIETLCGFGNVQNIPKPPDIQGNVISQQKSDRDNELEQELSELKLKYEKATNEINQLKHSNDQLSQQLDSLTKQKQTTKAATHTAPTPQSQTKVVPTFQKLINLDTISITQDERLSDELRECMQKMIDDSSIEKNIHSAMTNGTTSISISNNEENNIVCKDITIEKELYDLFDEIMTFHSWYYYQITSFKNNNNIVTVTIYRESFDLERNLMKYLSYMQYMPSRINDFGINNQIWSDYHGNCLHRFVGSLMFVYQSEFEKCLIKIPYQKFNPLIPCWVYVDENDSKCQSIDNKWNCYFLRVSAEYDNPFLINSSSKSDGENIDINDNNIVSSYSIYDIDIRAKRDPWEVGQAFRDFLQLYPHDRKKDDNMNNINDGQLFATELENKIIFRGILSNFFMRETINFNLYIYQMELKYFSKFGISQEILNNFGSKNNNEQCIAMHVRRGDKIDWCEKGIMAKEGCVFDHKFDDYINQTVKLINNNYNNINKNNYHFTSVIVITDDPKICDDSDKYVHGKVAKQSKLNYYCIGGKGQLDEYFNQTHDHARRIEFAKIMISLRWAKVCRGFIGNFNSNFAGLLYMFMCHYHKQCQPYYSFGEAKKLRFTWG